MNKLYMISLGGKVKGANIEVHDVQFVVAESIEAAIPLVKDHWYGNSVKLHMDSYMEIKGAEGYKVTLTDVAQAEDKRLFFAYLGGYNDHSTQEIHEVSLMVCGSEREAKSIAIKTKGFDHIQRHVDSVVDVAASLLMAHGTSTYLKLEPSTDVYKLVPDWFGYKRLDQA